MTNEKMTDNTTERAMSEEEYFTADVFAHGSEPEI